MMGTALVCIALSSIQVQTSENGKLNSDFSLKAPKAFTSSQNSSSSSHQNQIQSGSGGSATANEACECRPDQPWWCPCIAGNCPPAQDAAGTCFTQTLKHHRCSFFGEYKARCTTIVDVQQHSTWDDPGNICPTHNKIYISDLFFGLSESKIVPCSDKLCINCDAACNAGNGWPTWPQDFNETPNFSIMVPSCS